MTQPHTNEQLAYSLGAVSAGVQHMKAGAASGTLVISADAGKKLQNALQTAREGAAQLMQRIAVVGTPASLGTNAVSTSMTQKFVSRAEGAGTSLGPLLQTILARSRSGPRRGKSLHDSVKRN